MFALTASEIESLCRQLFFDKRLFADGTINCGMCHRPDMAFANPNSASRGIDGSRGAFNAPNDSSGMAAPIPSNNRPKAPSSTQSKEATAKKDLQDRLSRIPEYQLRFKRSFGDSQPHTLDRITKAIAAYELTLKSTQSLYGDWRIGRREHWSPEHEFGRQLFFGEAACSRCHSGPNFTSQELIPTLTDNSTSPIPPRSHPHCPLHARWLGPYPFRSTQPPPRRIPTPRPGKNMCCFASSKSLSGDDSR